MKIQIHFCHQFLLPILIFFFIISSIILAWQEPTLPPPQGNVPAPLNVGPQGQAKEGGLIIGTNPTLEYGFLVPYGLVGIGTLSPNPNYKLTIDGSLFSKGAYFEGNVQIGNQNTNFELRVNGKRVCLEDGTNCPSGW